MLYLGELSKRLLRHKNFIGFDIGNEINCSWKADVLEGDVWMCRVLQQMRHLCHGLVHVNGVDHQPWFGVNTFSPEVLMSHQEIVPLHTYPYFTGAGKYGKPTEKPYTHLPAAMTALARSYGNAPLKPIWWQEFGVCEYEMPRADVSRWMETAIQVGIEQGVSWFTWWGSHDVDRRFEFGPYEYDLGLISVDNQIKDRGLVFKRLAAAYRGKPVVIPIQALPPPPVQRTPDSIWHWMLEWMGESSV